MFAAFAFWVKRGSCSCRRNDAICFQYFVHNRIQTETLCGLLSLSLFPR